MLDGGGLNRPRITERYDALRTRNEPDCESGNRGFSLSYANRVLLLAFCYGVCVNLALALHRHYEARVFLLLGFLHVFSRIRSRSKPASLRWRSVLLLLMVAGVVVAISLSR